jgi:hypothetical protein
MCACPVSSVIEAGVDVIPGTLTSHEITLTWALHVSKGGKSGIFGQPEKLVKEGDIVILSDYLRGARRTTATRRPRTAHLSPH